jgi:hypothetical protein
MKVLPIYLFFINPSPYGMPDSSAYPIAADKPESGTPITKSAFIGCSFAKNFPACFLASYTLTFSIILSGLAKYIYSNMHK